MGNLKGQGHFVGANLGLGNEYLSLCVCVCECECSIMIVDDRASF